MGLYWIVCERDGSSVDSFNKTDKMGVESDNSHQIFFARQNSKQAHCTPRRPKRNTNATKQAIHNKLTERSTLDDPTLQTQPVHTTRAN